MVTLIPGCLGGAIDEATGLVTGKVAGAMALYVVGETGETVEAGVFIGLKGGMGRSPGELLVDL